jgi:hypothetical protein
MIQRIQTLYLLVSSILVALLFALPFAEIIKDGAVFLFNFNGISLNGVLKENGIVISILIGVILALHGYAIFSYKNRKAQVKIITYAILILTALFGVFVFFTWFSNRGSEISYKVGIIFPLVAIILDYLAILGIRKDEALIRSIDRIR